MGYIQPNSYAFNVSPNDYVADDFSNFKPAANVTSTRDYYNNIRQEKIAARNKAKAEELAIKKAKRAEALAKRKAEIEARRNS